MSKITVYEKPTCTTCRKVAKAFSEQGIDFQRVNYYIEPFSKSLLKSLLKKMNMKPLELIRTKDDSYKRLKNEIEKLSDEELIDLMVKNPDLIQRPIVEKGNKAILARPPERIKELF
ncbi:MAG: Spx/MgsR family RNA polymerase-binding regulatory protein [Ignavibacteriota bacterium]|jgi:arsenate reductase|nr:MAG: Spx/MgsR family RNA polymerase-binding regulatory protein [Ignavibacterium sp.]MBL1153533.1 Spx/MgsR family RNA polymerase-binding regulatory protein [Ignavibacteriota bacterium]MCO6448567.1 Spx/MgsR family RNA polymerase-binding regulatory protein [Ignavibacterium album]MCZ2270010.1 Spx/MgsR family RNA polymerase-binding regulatory protein [Ignavibacteriales bacterium]MDX9711549.1 Spx/MgsR family RNA polymerase-binding regulatory protein [Ignavibacteriaceae bacterium]